MRPDRLTWVAYRGCGVADGLPGADEIGREVVGDLYGIAGAGPADVLRLSEAWRPFRMWAVVLLRVAWGRRHGGPVSYRRDASRSADASRS